MTTRRPATDAEAKALASSLRLRILRMCLGTALTNKEIAHALDRDPASTLYHVRTLVKNGFLAAQTERRGAHGAREIPYLATKKSWQLEVPAQSRRLVEAFLLDAAEVAPEELDTTRLGLRLPPEQMQEFRDRLRELVDDFADRPDDPDAPAWSVFLAVHPDRSR